MGLTLFVVGLSGVATWQAYRDYRANQQWCWPIPSPTT
jgi:hypothetical protein